MILNHQYEFKDKLAEGTKGAFYSALDQKSGALCLVKAYRSFSKVEDYRGIQEEISSLQKIQKNNPPVLLKILDILEENKAWFVVFEEIKGVPLVKILSQSKGQLNSGEIVKYFSKLIDGILTLRDSSRNFVITNLDSQNIILTGEEIKILDFEQELVLQENPSPQEQPHHLSEKEIFEKAGRIFYFLLTRQIPPFSLANWRDPREFNPGLNSEMLNILRKCMDPRLEKQYQKLEDLQLELKNPDLLKEKVEEKRTDVPQVVPLSQILGQTEKRKLTVGRIFLFVFFIFVGLFLFKKGIDYLFTMPAKKTVEKFAVRNKALCAATSKGIVWIHLKSGKRINFFPLTGDFKSLIPIPLGQRFIVSDSNSDSVFLVNPNLPEKKWHLVLSGKVKSVAYDPVIGGFYACNGVDRQVMQTTLNANGSFSVIRFPHPPVDLRISPSGKKLYVVSEHDSALRVIDVGTKAVKKVCSFSETPKLLYVGKSRLVVYLSQSNVLEILTLSGNSIASFPVFLRSSARLVFSSPHTGIIWSHGSRLRVINLKLGLLTQTIRLNFSPVLAAADSRTGTFFLADKKGNIYVFSVQNMNSPRKIAAVPGISALSLWDP